MGAGWCSDIERRIRLRSRPSRQLTTRMSFGFQAAHAKLNPFGRQAGFLLMRGIAIRLPVFSPERSVVTLRARGKAIFRSVLGQFAGKGQGSGV